MEYENNDYYNDSQNLQDECKKYMFYHVTLTLNDGRTFDGIITNVDGNNVSMLSGEDVTPENQGQGAEQPQTQAQAEDQTRQFHSYGYGYGYGRPRRFRRFRPRYFPLSTLAALSLLPYPYIVQPPYPYYPYY